MKFYEKIKKEYVFIFVFLLATLIIFNVFDSTFTGLTTKVNSCSDQGYSCCLKDEGKGVNYFSLDDTCSQGKECWDYCESSSYETNLISANVVFSDFGNTIKDFFGNLFKKKVVGNPNCDCNSNSMCGTGKTCDTGSYTKGECLRQASTRRGGTLEGLCKAPSTACTNECSASEKRCGVNDALRNYQTCDNYDADPCLEWGSDIACGSAGSCYQGNCYPQKILAVNTIGLGSGTVTGTGINCGSSCSASFTYGSQISLTANPNAESTFIGWADCDSSSGNSCIINGIFSDRVVKATFDRTGVLYTLTITKPTNGKIVGTGIDCGTNGNDCTGSYSFGTSITLTAIADANYNFGNWGGSCSGTNNHCTLEINTAKTVGATFNLATSSCVRNKPVVTVNPSEQIGSPGETKIFTVSVKNNDQNCGASNFGNDVGYVDENDQSNYIESLIPSVSSLSLDQDETKTFTVSVKSKTTYTNDKRVTINYHIYNKLYQTFISDPKYETASFIYDLKITSACTLNQCASTTTRCDNGNPIVCPSATPICENNVCKAQTTNYALTITPPTNGKITSGTVVNCGSGATETDCTENYASGTSVTLTATPVTGYVFGGWSGACTGTTNPCTLTMDSAKTVGATFNLATQSLSAPGNPKAEIIAKAGDRFIVRLSWDKPNPIINKYKIYKGTSGTEKSVLTAYSSTWDYNKIYCGAVYENLNKCYYLDKNVDLEVTYTYKISAISDTNQEGTQTNNLQIKVDGIAPIIKPFNSNRMVRVDSVDKTKVSISAVAKDSVGINKMYIYVDDLVTPKKICSNTDQGILFEDELNEFDEGTCVYTTNYQFGTKHIFKVNFSSFSGKVNNTMVPGEFTSGDEESTAKGNCDNDQDDDYDGATDEFDTGCGTSSYVKLVEINPYLKGTSNKATKPYEDSDIDLKCTIGLNEGNDKWGEARACVFGKVANTKCIFNEADSDDQDLMFDCNVGAIGTKNVSCNILESCNAAQDASFKYIRHLNYTINVTKPTLCAKIKGTTKVKISSIELDDEEYQAGETIKPILIISNEQGDESDELTISVSAQLYDLNRKLLVASDNETEIISGSSEEEYNKLNIKIPSDLRDSKFKLYFKVFEEDDESNICIEGKQDVVIEGKETKSCKDKDKDGAKDQSCGGNDCNDNDKNINPRANEVCADNKDNDCNGLIDDQDPLCVSSGCTTGQTRACGQGICTGTQLCTSNQWGTCLGGQSPATEICTDSLDNDCDGSTDVSDSDCSVDDSDDDDLPDDWEEENFNSLRYKGTDDVDKDGFTNKEEYDAGTDPNNKEDKPSSGEKSSLLYFLLGIGGVLLLALILILLFTKKKKPQPYIQQPPIRTPFTSSEQRVNPVLKEYVQHSLAKGYNRDQIRKALLAKGWKNNEIEQAFRKQ